MADLPNTQRYATRPWLRGIGIVLYLASAYCALIAIGAVLELVYAVRIGAHVVGGGSWLGLGLAIAGPYVVVAVAGTLVGRYLRRAEKAHSIEPPIPAGPSKG